MHPNVVQEHIEGSAYSAVFVSDSRQIELIGVTRLWSRADLESRRERAANPGDEPNLPEHPFQYVGIDRAGENASRSC